MPIVECVPNFSEGRNQAIIDQIARAISGVDGATLLDVDPGQATNRTVVTLVGEPDAVEEAAFQGPGFVVERSVADSGEHQGVLD